jgi:hypothetical protein
VSHSFARDALWQLKSDQGVRREKARILDRHVERRNTR